MGNVKVHLALLAVLGLLLQTLVAFAGEYELRDWTNLENVTVKAKFVKCDKSTIHLELENGKQTAVHINKLSPQDWCYLDSLDMNYTALHAQASQGYSVSRWTFPRIKSIP